MKNKLSQATIFIIISLIVFGIIVIGSFLLKSDKNQKQQSVPYEIMPVKAYVENCLKQTAEEGIVYIGNTGGFLTIPENSINGTAYYLFNNKTYMPSRESIANSISDYIDNFIGFCLNDFRDLDKYNISYGNSKTITQINQNSIALNMNLPLSIEYNKNSYTISNFSSEIFINLNSILNARDEIMSEQMKKTDAICFSCNKRISDENQVTINMLNGENDSVIFSLSDENSKINNKTFMFYFANQY